MSINESFFILIKSAYTFDFLIISLLPDGITIESSPSQEIQITSFSLSGTVTQISEFESKTIERAKRECVQIGVSKNALNSRVNDRSACRKRISG